MAWTHDPGCIGLCMSYGSKIPAVLPAYTDDGGNLAPDARVRFARELVALLASLPQVP